MGYDLTFEDGKYRLDLISNPEYSSEEIVEVLEDEGWEHYSDDEEDADKLKYRNFDVGRRFEAEITYGEAVIDFDGIKLSPTKTREMERTLKGQDCDKLYKLAEKQEVLKGELLYS